MQSAASAAILPAMGLPASPVTLTPEQIESLARHLSNVRHDINNHLSLIVAAAELIRMNPAAAERMSNTLNEQPPKISEALLNFSLALEKTLGVTRD